MTRIFIKILDIVTTCIASYFDIVYVHIGMILSIMYFINIIYFKLYKMMSHVLFISKNVIGLYLFTI